MSYLKFRIWDSHNQTMVLTENIVCEGYFNLENGFLKIGKFNEGLVIMQATGLKDINEQDIFEGDIVSFTQIGITDVIIYKAPVFSGKKSDLTNYHLEVIGNIYKNPELIPQN